MAENWNEVRFALMDRSETELRNFAARHRVQLPYIHGFSTLVVFIMDWLKANYDDEVALSLVQTESSFKEVQ